MAEPKHVLTSVNALTLFDKVSILGTDYINVDFKNLKILLNEIKDDDIKSLIIKHLDTMSDNNITASRVESYLQKELAVSGLNWNWGDIIVYVPNMVRENSGLEKSVFMVGKTSTGNLTVVPLAKSHDGEPLIPTEFYCPHVDPRSIFQGRYFQYGNEPDEFFEWKNTLFPVRPSLFTITKKGYGIYANSGKQEPIVVVEYGNKSLYMILLGENEGRFKNAIQQDKIVYMLYQGGCCLRMV